jgi:REP element-mobilizing transposase RayT
MDNPPKRKQIRLKQFDYGSPYAIFFLTMCSLNKKAIFVDNGLNNKIIDTLKEEKNRVGHSIYVYCLMPDHLHLLASPLGTRIPITQLMGGISSKATRLLWNYGFSGKIFQRSFYDHVVRKREDLKSIGQYILDNPVRKGLAEKWEAYPYCGLLDPFPV